MRVKYSVALAALALVGLTACTGGGATPTVVVTASTPGPSASPVVTPVVTPTPADHFYTVQETFSLSPETEPQGSGCSPGLGTLTDGVWFGHVTAWSSASISFDMECWWTGSGALAEAAARGDEVNNDYYITNDVTTVRTVTVAPDAIAYKGDSPWDNTAAWVPHTVAEVIADPWGTAADSALIVWIAVNDGVVTSLIVMWVP